MLTPSCSRVLAMSDTVARRTLRLKRKSSKRRAAVKCAAVVPHDEVVHAPAVGIDELALRRVRQQLVDQGASLGLAHAEDAVTSACSCRATKNIALRRG
jgi:hypothetical protein